MGTNLYDLAVIGGGPAGLSAAINAASEGLRVVLVNSELQVGGQSKYSAAIENYLGFPSKITGQQLAQRAAKQAKKFGTEFKVGCAVTNIEEDGEDKVLSYTRFSRPFGNKNGALTNEQLVCKAVVIACGLDFRGTGAVNEQEFMGKGVMYNADKNMARYFKGKQVLIIGGGNSAGQAALHWSKFAEVSIAARQGLDATMSDYLVQRIKEANIPVHLGADLKKVSGDGRVQMCELADGNVSCDAVLPFIGSVPKTEFAKKVCDCDVNGFLVSSKVAGILIAGDCRLGSVKRIAAAVGEGASAVPKVHQYLSSRKVSG